MAPPYDEASVDMRRGMVLTQNHSIPEKMEMFNASTKGIIEDLEQIADTKKYSLVEEVSKAGYYWTVFHYASHYGHVKFLENLLKRYEDHPMKYEIFN